MVFRMRKQLNAQVEVSVISQTGTHQTQRLRLRLKIPLYVFSYTSSETFACEDLPLHYRRKIVMMGRTRLSSAMKVKCLVEFLNPSRQRR